MTFAKFDTVLFLICFQFCKQIFANLRHLCYRLIYKKHFLIFYFSILIYFQIQMNLILFLAILQFFITNTVQNLIRFGDFQNIIPPYPPGKRYYVVCSKYCNGIWYNVFPKEGIQLQVNFPVPGKNHTTTAVDMIYKNYIKLCQKINVVEIRKTYQYTFDMNCNSISKIKSCSVWVLLNDKVINGSNHTHTDKLVHHNVGYMNITQQNNTICFQSQQVPFIQLYGTEVDNITLQIYTGKVPCNVINCKLCVLNFPDICQVFQQLPPEAPQVHEGSSCESKFYLNGKICKICLFPCETCQTYARNCISCQNSYHLQENQCVISNKLTSAASIIVSMPGIEFFSIGQILLEISDQFWPYYSHHRTYGQQTNEILTFIHTLQNNKWFLLSLDKKINFNFQSLNFSDYSRYSNQKFLTTESRTSYFWDGAFEIVFFSFPSMLVFFFVINVIFYLTFKFPISIYFRRYSFLLMIYFLGIGQEISYLSFLSFSNGMNLFSFKFHDKLGHIAWIFVFFLLVLFCSGAFFVAKILYEKLSKYFIDGFFPNLQSFHILSFLSMKAFVIGSINALLATNYQTLIISLESIEMVYLVGVIYLQWKNTCFKIQTFMFLQILKSIIMAVFNISLWIDWKMRISQEGQTEQQTKKLLDFNCKALVIVIIGLGVLQAISTYFSGREMLNRRKKQAPKSKMLKKQVLKIISIKQNAKIKKESPMKQQIKSRKDCLYPNIAIEKNEKQLSQKVRTQKSKKMKIKKTLKKKSDELHVIFEEAGQNDQDQQCYQIINHQRVGDT